jgi:hypothetical protein
VRDQPGEEIGRRDEVGVEDADKLAARHLEPRLERARLVAGAVLPVEVLDVDPLRGVTAHRQLGDAARFVGRVVQHLDLVQVARVVDRADRVDQTLGDVHLVVERKLDRDDRQRIERRTEFRLLVPVAHVEIHEVIPVPPIDGEHDHDEKICGEREGFSWRHGLQVEPPPTQSLILLLAI